jgi:N-methylhydantoinase A/oxoprolinase/acetone carboxylase beta subunit
MATHWNKEAAVLGARIWARQMRYMYGLGTWTLGDEIAPSRQVVDKVITTICQKLIEAGLNDAGQMNEDRASNMASLLTQMALQSGAATSDESPHVFQLRFAPELPLVAVGAPAGSYYPEVARGLGMRLVVPQFAEVANAVGAVLGEVSQRVHVTVTQPVKGTFRVFSRFGPKDFAGIEPALTHARELAQTEARANALEAGAASVQVRFSQKDNNVNNDIDGNMFFEAVVTATAFGPPVISTTA